MTGNVRDGDAATATGADGGGPDTRSAALLDEMKGLHPALIDLSLDRVCGLLRALGDPQLALSPVIHVAGTNGKGSTTAFLVAILQAAGLRVHAYTSPHLVRFHERIAVPDEMGRTAPISEDRLVDVLTRTRAANGDAPMTYFEITTAAAFLAFREIPADVVVLEVGLGGRLDATNVVPEPAVTVITPVSMDHADKLGETLGEIAREKAGIIKPGRPCVVGPQRDAAQDVIRSTAQVNGAPLISWARDFDAYAQNGRLVYQEGEALLDLPLPALRGGHQIVNAATAIAAIRQLAQVDERFAAVSDAAFAQGLTRVAWPARMMPLVGTPLSDHLRADDELWLDGGHNPDAGQAIARLLADLDDRDPKSVHLVCGMMAHKDAPGFLSPFAGIARSLVAVPVIGGFGTANAPEAIAAASTDVGIPGRTAETVEAALSSISRDEPAAKRVLICGSLYLAGAVLAVANKKDRA